MKTKRKKLPKATVRMFKKLFDDLPVSRRLREEGFRITIKAVEERINRKKDEKDGNA